MPVGVTAWLLYARSQRARGRRATSLAYREEPRPEDVVARDHSLGSRGQPSRLPRGSLERRESLVVPGEPQA